MMKKFKILVILLMGLLLVKPLDIQAYTVGETVNETLSQSFSAPAAGFYYWEVSGIGSGSGTVGDPINSNYVSSASIPFSFTPSAAGSYTLTVSFDVSDSNGNPVAAPAVTRTVVVSQAPAPTPDPTPTPTPDPTPTPTPEPDPEPEPELSNNYYLSSLTVSPGSLSPAFTSRNDIYSLALPADATSFNVGATVEDVKSSIVSGIGTFEVGPSDFLHRVVVRAENGAIWEYHINVIVNDTRSDNSQLEFLTVSSGTLSPAFNPDVLEYTVEVDPSVKSVNIAAEVADDKATLTGTGSVDMVEGETVTRNVNVTAENGSMTTYVVNFKVSEKPAQTITFENKTLTFETDYPKDLEKLGFTLKNNLEGFDPETPYYENKTYKAVYLNDGTSSSWYLVDGKTVTGRLVLVTLDEKVYGFFELPQDIQTQKGMTLKPLKLGDQEVSGWVYDDPNLSDFQVFYLMDETGEFDYFLFHTQQDGLMKVGEYRLLNPGETQEVSEEVVDETQDSATSDYESIIFLIISLLSVVGLVVVVMLYRNYQNKKNTL